MNVFKIRGYNSVNLKNGYVQLDIRSPKEIVNYENKKSKSFDTVKGFREIKEKIPAETENMTFGEFKEYLRKNNHPIPQKSELEDNLVQNPVIQLN